MRVRQLCVAAGLLACGEDTVVLRQLPAAGSGTAAPVAAEDAGPDADPVSPGAPDSGGGAGGTPEPGSGAPDDAGAPLPSGLAGELLGYWLTRSYLGDCL
ncbi:MAG TPA: hypothetical protein VMG12_43075, partial [Polyangiaceae bacterium]|nr:hypothetical protein [Polyangiaceae bacterium]